MSPCAGSEPITGEVDLQWGVKIPLRDGIRLNGTLYLPRSARASAPAIFTLTPYVGQTYHDVGMYFAAHGYPFLCVDVRGRGNSDGDFRPLIQEARDGCDVVEWLSKQSFNNCKVAMWGGSYAGFAQWATAGELPPQLATIVPAAAPYLGVDFPMRNNIAFPYLMQWLTLVWGRTGQDKLFWDNQPFWNRRFKAWFESRAPFKTLDVHLGCPSRIFQEWVAHPEQDEYWDRYNLSSAQYAGLSLPILTITGAYDDDQPGALMHYRRHMEQAPPASSARHYLVIGPWDHAGTRTPQAEFLDVKAGPASLVDLPKLHRQWYAWTMQGGAKPEFLQDQVAYYVMGADRWRYAHTLSAVTSHSVPFFLQSTGNATDVYRSGVLSREAPVQGEPDHYSYDPSDISHAALEATVHPESQVDQRMIHALSGKQLIYHTAPFAADIEISGFFKLSAWLSIDQPDTDFHVAVYEIGLDGTSIMLTTDCLRARYRESLRTPKLVSTREPLRYDFERFTFMSRLIKQGSRLRLVIGPGNSIYRQKNYNSGAAVCEESGADACTVTVRLFHDASRASALYVPIGKV